MQKLIIVSLLLLSACTATATPGPVIESTATLAQTNTPLPDPSPTIQVVVPTPTLTVTIQVSPTAEPAAHRVSPVDGMPQVYIQAGTFRMGGLDVRRAPNELPDHDVTLDAFWIDQLEVTNAMFTLCVSAGACDSPQNLRSQRRNEYFDNPEFKDYPVVYVDWNMAKAYCEWRGADLPTEAQWEKAARASDEPTYPWGNELDCNKANYTNGSRVCVGGTTKVGSYESGKSPYGVYDMAGNVWEWVADWYSESYYSTSISSSNPFGPDFGRARVARGGSWTRPQGEIRSANRINYAPTYYNFDLGFRCAAAVLP